MSRTAIFALAGLAIMAITPAQAQNRERLYIEVQPRSWLDAGAKGVQVGQYQNYVNDMQGSVGPIGGVGARAFNLLPDRFSGGRPFVVDIPAPEFLRR